MALDLNDKTSNGNNLTNSGGATEYTTTLPYATGNTRAAAFAAASSQFMEANDTVANSITGDMTIICNVNFASLPGSGSRMGLLTKLDVGAGISYGLFLHNNSGTYRFDMQLHDGTTKHGYLDWTPTVNTWYEVGMVYVASAGTVDFYVNGSHYGTQQSGLGTATTDTTTKLCLGACFNTYPGVLLCLDGRLDNVQLYNAALSAPTIAANCNKQLLGTETNLVAYYPFEDAASPPVATTPTGYNYFM